MRLLVTVIALGASLAHAVLAQCPNGSPPPCPPPQRTSATPSAPTSLAVLYFDNLSSDTADAYLAAGLTEEITSRLGDVGRLQVTSRYAVRRYRSGPVPEIAAAGRELGVRYIVEGSVRHAGNRVRVSTRLIDARSGFRVWGSEYDRATSDLLSLQEDIAREVATQIAGRLLPAERSALANRPTRNADAYDHFLRGNYLLGLRTQSTMTAAIAEYEAAFQLDPGFRAAQARAAYAYAVYMDWGWPYVGLSAESLLARGFAASNQVLAADSGSTDAWMARGYLLAQRYPRTLSGVRGAFERAIALEPENAEAWHQYGWILLIERDTASAFTAFRRALAVDPKRGVTWMHLGFASLLLGRAGAAATYLDSTIAVDPSSSINFALRALVRLRLGNLSGAREDAQAAQRVSGFDRFWGDAPLAMVQARLGDRVAARARLDALADSAIASGGPVNYEFAWLVGAALVSVGEPDKSIGLIELARPRGAHLWTDLLMPELDSIRDDPRFQKVLSDSYWTSEGP